VILATVAFLASLSTADACEELTTPSERVQVAWVSNLPRRVKAGTWIEVTRVSELRTWIRDHEADTLRLLQGLGMTGRKAARAKDAKVTIFDVDRSWLCRPLAAGTPGAEVAGVATCDEPQQKAMSGSRKGYSGCGYTMDTNASTRGLDVYRITWEVASAWGFCVMPLDRFLDGA